MLDTFHSKPQMRLKEFSINETTCKVVPWIESPSVYPIVNAIDSGMLGSLNGISELVVIISDG